MHNQSHEISQPSKQKLHDQSHDISQPWKRKEEEEEKKN